MLRHHPDRELAFRVRLQLTEGALMLGEQEVGRVTGQIVVPIKAVYRAHPRPGQYIFAPPNRGQLVPMSGSDEGLPQEVIVSTVGYLDVDAVKSQIDVPAGWTVIPAELLSELQLVGELEYEDVDADDEYKTNEPGDLDEARQRFEGRWRLKMEFPLGESVSVDEPRLSLDRWEFEVDARFAELKEVE